eukprot:365585-Chlamydomonas_euryale.AAC.3
MPCRQNIPTPFPTPGWRRTFPPNFQHLADADATLPTRVPHLVGAALHCSVQQYLGVILVNQFDCSLPKGDRNRDTLERLKRGGGTNIVWALGRKESSGRGAGGESGLG